MVKALYLEIVQDDLSSFCPEIQTSIRVAQIKKVVVLMAYIVLSDH